MILSVALLFDFRCDFKLVEVVLALTKEVCEINWRDKIQAKAANFIYYYVKTNSIIVILSELPNLSLFMSSSRLCWDCLHVCCSQWMYGCTATTLLLHSSRTVSSAKRIPTLKRSHTTESHSSTHNSTSRIIWFFTSLLTSHFSLYLLASLLKVLCHDGIPNMVTN